MKTNFMRKRNIVPNINKVRMVNAFSLAFHQSNKRSFYTVSKHLETAQLKLGCRCGTFTWKYCSWEYWPWGPRHTSLPKIVILLCLRYLARLLLQKLSSVNRPFSVKPLNSFGLNSRLVSFWIDTGLTPVISIFLPKVVHMPFESLIKLG